MKDKERAQPGLKYCRWLCASFVRYASRRWTDRPALADL